MARWELLAYFRYPKEYQNKTDFKGILQGECDKVIKDVKIKGI
jgi:hypothetical protein